jgi:hypothetical protein
MQSLQLRSRTGRAAGGRCQRAASLARPPIGRASAAARTLQVCRSRVPSGPTSSSPTVRPERGMWSRSAVRSAACCPTGALSAAPNPAQWPKATSPTQATRSLSRVKAYRRAEASRSPWARRRRIAHHRTQQGTAHEHHGARWANQPPGGQGIRSTSSKSPTSPMRITLGLALGFALLVPVGGGARSVILLTARRCCLV